MTRIGTSQPPPQTNNAEGAPPRGTGESTSATPVPTTSADEASVPAAPPEAGRVVDGFDGTVPSAARPAGGMTPPSTTPPRDRKLAEASERFSTRLDDALNHDALSLSRGETPWRAGEPLSDVQASELKDATKDYLMDVPLGSFAPGVKAGVGALLERAGVRPDNLDGMSLRDVEKHVGSEASDFAMGLVDKVKDRAPAAYYGVLGAGALAAGGLAYTKGSDALRSLGIKPEAKLGLFNDHIELRAGAEWDAKFTNFEPTAGIRARTSGERFSLDASADFTRHGLTDARFSGALELSPRTSLIGSAEYQSLRSLRDPNPNLSLAGNESDRLRASLSLMHRPSANTSLAITGTYDNVTGPWVGVGFTARF